MKENIFKDIDLSSFDNLFYDLKTKQLTYLGCLLVVGLGLQVYQLLLRKEVK